MLFTSVFDIKDLFCLNSDYVVIACIKNCMYFLFFCFVWYFVKENFVLLHQVKSFFVFCKKTRKIEVHLFLNRYMSQKSLL